MSASSIELAQTVADRFSGRRVTYVGIFLDDTSKRRLLQWWQSTIRTRLLPKLYAHHVTLKFRPSDSELERFNIGAQALVQVLGYAEDEKAQAVLVRPSVNSANRHPHITIATNHGVPPVYSNDLLAKGYTRKAGPILRGTVETG